MQKAGPISGLKLNLVNNILTQVIGYFEKYPENLKVEGILRISGEQSVQLQVLEKIRQDPLNRTLLDQDNVRLLSQSDQVHNVIGVLKKCLKDPLGFSPQVTQVIQGLSLNLVDDLMRLNATQEARFIHNLLHLGVLVAKQQKYNKMTPYNVAVILNPQIANVTGEITLGFDHDSQEKIEKILCEGLSETSKLKRPFNSALKNESNLTDTENSCSSQSTTPRDLTQDDFNRAEYEDLIKKLDAFIWFDLNEDLIQDSTVYLTELQEVKYNPLIKIENEKKSTQGGQMRPLL